MYVIELQMRYISRLLMALGSVGKRSLEVREEVCAEYNTAVQREHARSIWTHPGMTTYYRNERGRVVFVMPFLNIDYWHMTRHADLENYIVR